jgi:ribosome-associated protein YbcJ (S4-like RNA binding protein)
MRILRCELPRVMRNGHQQLRRACKLVEAVRIDQARERAAESQVEKC